jgi:hypothetical protein
MAISEQRASAYKKMIWAIVDNLCKINYHNRLEVKFCIKNWLVLTQMPGFCTSRVFKKI